MLEQTVVEALSWRLASTLVRRHPELVVRREHPGGGQYDVLVLRTGRGCTIMLNRVGTVQVHGRDDGHEPVWEPLTWDDVARRDLRAVVSELESSSGLGHVERALPSAPPKLVYRTLSALANLALMAVPAEISVGSIDTSGCGGGPATWLHDFPGVRRRIEGEGSTGAETGFDYWHVRLRGIRVAFEVPSSDTWSASGRRLTLATQYAELGRSMPRLLAAVLALGVDE